MEDIQDIVLKGLIESDDIKRVLKRTKSDYDFQTINKKLIDDFISDGWQIGKKNQNSFKIKKLKPHDRRFEDRVWSLFAQFGYHYLNADRSFRIPYTKNVELPGKQIDVFAVDDETILLIECKSSEVNSRKSVSFLTEINEIKGINQEITANLRKVFESKLKILWIFCTNNIIINNNDKERMKDYKILHLNQDDISYYERLVYHLGISAKYQLYGRLFANLTIPELKNKVPAIRGKMGGFTYYSFSIEPEALLKISYILHRLNTTDDTLITYQRMVKRSRIKEINCFLDEGGFFPNAIIINIDTKNSRQLQFDSATCSEHDSNSVLGVLHLPKEYRSAFIIDGQHRLLGYGNNKYKATNTIPVVAFENLPAETQSKLFVEINHKQKSVAANLLRSLDADLKWDSPIADDAIKALKSKLAQLLNERENSPLYNRIITGEDPRTQTRCITLAYIFDYALNKTNFFGEIRKRNLIKTGPLYAGDLSNKTLEKAYEFFRRVFSLIEELLPDQWQKGDSEGGFISRNIGVASIIALMWDIIDHIKKNKFIDFEKLNSEEVFDEIKPYLIVIIEHISSLSREELQRMSGQWGSTGVKKVRQEFQRIIHLKYPSFEPEGLLQYLKESSGIYNDETDEVTDKLQLLINHFVINKLQNEYGNEHDKWWRLGIPKQIQKDCAIKSIETDPPEPHENFLLLLDYQKIVKDNWKLFGDYFTPPNMKQASKDDKLDWFVKFNTIRNKVKHPERQDVSESEYNLIKNIQNWLVNNLNDEISAKT